MIGRAADEIDAQLGSWRGEVAKAGLPVALAWRRGHFLVAMEAGETKVKGYLSPHFGAFYGTRRSAIVPGAHRRYTLV